MFTWQTSHEQILADLKGHWLFFTQTSVSYCGIGVCWSMSWYYQCYSGLPLPQQQRPNLYLRQGNALKLQAKGPNNRGHTCWRSLLQCQSLGNAMSYFWHCSLSLLLKEILTLCVSVLSFSEVAHHLTAYSTLKGWNLLMAEKADNPTNVCGPLSIYSMCLSVDATLYALLRQAGISTNIPCIPGTQSAVSDGDYLSVSSPGYKADIC